MRRVAVVAIVLGCSGSGAAIAAPAALAVSPAQALAQAAFRASASPVDPDPIGNLLDRESYAPLFVAGAGGPVASLRIRQGELFAPGDLPFTERSATDPKDYEVSVIRVWPGALSFDAGRLAVDVSPHAGLGVIGGDRAGGGSAEAGAAVELSKSDLAGERLKAMGVRDGATFGERGRWYLFAAASGRAVGLNMLRGEAGWNRAGWSTDPTSRLVGDAQLGVGWRSGAIQSSIGYVHREVKGQHMLYGVDPKSDSMVAFSLSIRPRK